MRHPAPRRVVTPLVRLTVVALIAASGAGLFAADGAAARVAHTAFTAHGSVQQVYVLGAHPGQRLSLLDRHGRVVQTQRAGSLGGIVYRNVPAGPGYRVANARRTSVSARVTVMTDRSAPPSTRLYDQKIPTSGYGYLTVRDGTKLAIDVHLPAGPGPYPTLIEYSGYGYADPAGPQNGIAPIANLLGFAVVDVNMRGTGCSGGAFDYFDTLERLDGYDVIETVAHQPWVLHHKVGMMGISYGGISQLFVAATDPPDLAAIAPLSVIDSSATTLYPGGILNTGFALQWAEQRDHDALPASATGGQAWALARIKAGDATCKANQALHPEAVNLVSEIRANRYYVPAVADPLDPITFVHKIKVPVYIACQWTDEQTGGHCPDLAQHMTGTRHKWFTFTNGVHADSLDPDTLTRWFDFLELYVARRAPNMSPAVRAIAPTLYETALGIPNVTLEPACGSNAPKLTPTSSSACDPIQGLPSYAAALAAFQRLPSIRILFENGAGPSPTGTVTPGDPYPAFQQSFSRFPLPGTRARFWYLGPGGRLTGKAPRAAGHNTFTWRKDARPPTDFTGNTGAGGLWGATPDYHWEQNPPGTSVSYITAPLKSNTVIVGAGALQAWVRSSTPDVDLQVTISEVRPDGEEMFVQDGWLRASERKLDRAKSTLLEPVPSFRRSDVQPMPRGRFVPLTVPFYYEGHVYRAGSRIRITISAPSGDQPVWSFGETVPHGTAKVAVAFSRSMPSRVVLPVVPGVKVPTGLPACKGVRGEPCRPYKP